MISEKGLCKILKSAFKNGGYSVIQVRSQAEAQAPSWRRKSPLSSPLFRWRLRVPDIRSYPLSVGARAIPIYRSLEEEMVYRYFSLLPWLLVRTPAAL